MDKINTFTQLIAWQEGHKVVLMTYDIVRSFPDFERFILTSQILRAAISITSNIAEGFSRTTQKEKLHFYGISKGSTTELQNQLLIARDVGYLKPKDFDKIAIQTISVHKLINGLMRSIR